MLFSPDPFPCLRVLSCPSCFLVWIVASTSRSPASTTPTPYCPRRSLSSSRLPPCPIYRRCEFRQRDCKIRVASQERRVSRDPTSRHAGEEQKGRKRSRTRERRRRGLCVFFVARDTYDQINTFKNSGSHITPPMENQKRIYFAV